MSISTYSELQTAVSNWLERSDLTARLADFIDIAETHINDDLRVRSMIESSTVTPSQSVKYVSFPTGFIEPISFVNEEGEELEQLHPDELAEYAYNAPAGDPRYFSITSRINFECVASSSLSYPIIYYKKLDLATDLTNQVLTDYPNIYLYGTLAHAEMWIMNDQRYAYWQNLYEIAVKKANNRNQTNLRKLRTDYPLSGGRFDISRGY